MKKIITLGLFTGIPSFLLAQDINTIINAKEVERIEQTLASDDMQGRRVFTPGIEKAADFIIDEFEKTGLQPLHKGGSYKQNFSMLKPAGSAIALSLDGAEVDKNNILVISPQKELKVNEHSGYEIIAVDKREDFFSKILNSIQSSKNELILIDTGFAKYFPRLKYFTRQFFAESPNIIFVLTANHQPQSFTLQLQQTFVEQELSNLVGLLPGKGLKNEYVIFSGHYDHLGIGKPVNGDSVYNGANDDAAGTTAMLMLAKYFKAKNDNERTLVFAAFTAEEIGEFGSEYFSKQFAPSKVMAMFNIEMIGTESKWGRGSAYITGYEKTDMGKILQRNLEGSAFTFYPDPYTKENLFYRSDNATLAKLGVPAHTISTSKMDDEPNYHKPSDETGTLDMNNMAEIIKAIAISSTTIVSGKDTPSRVDTKKPN